MGLSEHEQRVLDELERGLYADDEQLARRIQKAAAKSPARQSQSSAARRIAGVLVGVIGLGVILVSAIMHLAWMGAIGFVITLAGLTIATSSARPDTELQRAGANKNSKKPKAPKRPASGNLLYRLDDFFQERWDRRQG